MRPRDQIDARLVDNITSAIRGHVEMAVALSKIARGRDDNGRPLAAEKARQLARDTLTELELDWTHVLKVRAEFEAVLSKR
jgi:hypothetical protein